ncbi:hypothetical protein D3C71_2049550 [compost metagenome]
MTAELTDINIIFVVVFVFDFANDQFQNIFNGHQTGYAAELINDNRHVITLGAEFFQHPVNTLAFRYYNRCAQR